MLGSTTEKEFPLPPPLRAYTLSTGSAGPTSLSIVHESSNSERYMASIEPIFDMCHCSSITLYSQLSHNRVGTLRMEDGCDTIDLSLGDSEEAGKCENCLREYMYTRHDELDFTMHEFALGLGDDLRRDFKWFSVDIHPHPTWYTAMFSRGTYSRGFSKLVHGLSYSHSENNQKATETKDGSVETVHQELVTNAQPRCLRLIDCNAGETVAMVLRHTALMGGEIVDSDIGDEDTRGRIVIFRDFWETGQHEEIWDRMVLLSGLVALERADME